MSLTNLTQEQTDAQNRETCKRIAEELEAYASGDVYECPECGEHCTFKEDKNEDGEPVYVCTCGCVSEYEPDEVGVYDYFSDALDLEYRISSNGDFRSVKVMVACGGPNIFIDTATKQVELYWWTDRASYPISCDAADAVDWWAEELYNCTR